MGGTGAHGAHRVLRARRRRDVARRNRRESAARARKVVVRAAPRDVAVDYQSLYEEVKDSIDDYRTRERKALDEVESLKDKEEATQSRILS